MVRLVRSRASQPRSFGTVEAQVYQGVPNFSIWYWAGTVFSPVESVGERSVPGSTAMIGAGLSRWIVGDGSKAVVTRE
jgi:hypothetical protein